MKNFRGFQVIHMAWSERKPSYVKIIDRRNNITAKVSLTETSQSNTEEVAKEYLESIGINVVGCSMADKGFMLFSEDFSTTLK